MRIQLIIILFILEQIMYMKKSPKKLKNIILKIMKKSKKNYFL